MKKITIAVSTVLAVLTLGTATANYPEKPITIVVPFPAGGSTDALARSLGQKIGTTLGQTIVVENRAGASGNIGANYVAKSNPDGYTLFLGTSTVLSVNQNLYSNLPYDAQKDFAPVILTTLVPNVVAVPAALPVKTLAELNTYLKNKKGQGNYSSAGNGTPSHLGSELYKKLAGVPAAHIPYKGGAAALLDLAAGRTTYMLAVLAEVMPLEKAGKLRILAVTTAERLPDYPEIPTVAESIPGFRLIGWEAVTAPASTPAPVIKKLNDAFNMALQHPEIKQKLSSTGHEIAGGPPQRLADMMQAESVKWKKVIDDVGIKVD